MPSKYKNCVSEVIIKHVQMTLALVGYYTFTSEYNTMDMIKIQLTILIQLLILPNELFCEVQKQRKCLREKWVNFKESDATLIHKYDSVTFSQCFRICGSLSDCTVINFSAVNQTCELREDMSNSKYDFNIFNYSCF